MDEAAFPDRFFALKENDQGGYREYPVMGRHPGKFFGIHKKRLYQREIYGKQLFYLWLQDFAHVAFVCGEIEQYCLSGKDQRIRFFLVGNRVKHYIGFLNWGMRNH